MRNEKMLESTVGVYIQRKTELRTTAIRILEIRVLVKLKQQMKYHIHKCVENKQLTYIWEMKKRLVELDCRLSELKAATKEKAASCVIN